MLEGDSVVAFSEAESVVAPSEGNLVAASSDGDSVVASSGVASVVASVEGDSVVASSEDDSVVAPSEGNSVVSSSEGDLVIASPGGDSVVTFSDGDSVVASSEDDSVVAPLEGNSVVSSSEGDSLLSSSEGDSVVASSEVDSVEVFLLWAGLVVDVSVVVEARVVWASTISMTSWSVGNCVGELSVVDDSSVTSSEGESLVGFLEGDFGALVAGVVVLGCVVGSTSTTSTMSPPDGTVGCGSVFKSSPPKTTSLPSCARLGAGVSVSTFSPSGVGIALASVSGVSSTVSLSGGDVSTCMPMSVEPASDGAQPTIIPSVKTRKNIKDSVHQFLQ